MKQKHFMIIFLAILLSNANFLISCSKTQTETKASTKASTSTNTNSESSLKSTSSTEAKAESQSLSSTEFSTNSESNFKIKSKNLNSNSNNADFKFQYQTYSKTNNLANYKIKNKNKHRTNSHQPSYILGKDPKYAQSYWEGWVSYIHYSGKLKKVPKKLFKNTEYFHQRIPMANTKKKDKNGSLMIPNKSKFYLVVTPTSLQIFTSRRHSYKHQWDSLEIKYIKGIPEDNFMKGGLHNIVRKSKIGYCFDLKVSIKSRRKSWLICVDDPKQKEKLMKIILRLKLKIQRKKGKFETQAALKLKKKKAALSKALAKKKAIDTTENERVKAKKPLDGYWVLIWDWSECSLKCGGGTSHQQWRCMPPKNGGKPCKGSAIRVKPCNSQPCPGLDSVLALKKAKATIAKPIIKVGTFSKRLQRYEKCVVKDNDAYSAKFNKKTRHLSKIPIRIVMNNYTITMYKDDDYQDVEHSFKLDETRFKIDKNHFCCFTLTDETAEKMVCGYDKYCGSAEGNEWALGWNKHFGLFKNACRMGRYTLLTHIDEENLKKGLKKKISDGKSDMQRKRAKLIKERLLKSMAKKNNPIKKAHEDGFKALTKELKLEKLIKAEEMEREKLELDNIASKINLEKEKANCLKRNIKEKKLDAEILNERKNNENEANKFRKDMSKKVLKNRKNFKKMINAMRAKAALRKAAMARQLNALRAKMAAEMEKANKVGDIKKCEKGKKNTDYRSGYCDKVFVDDFVRNEDCKGNNFCYTCCENEFGNMHIDKREVCYNMCDGTLKKKKKKNEKRRVPGLWNWK